MKHFKIIITGLAVISIAFTHTSCQKKLERISDVQSDFSNKAIVQVYEATVNATRNYIYVDGKQISGATFATGGLFPVSGTGFSVDGGQRSFLVRDTLPAATQVQFNFAETFGAGKHYTVFLYDTITAIKQKTVLDNIVVPADTTSRIRFANFMYNTVASPNVDVYSYYKAANIFTNIPTTEVTDFIAYPSRIPVDTLYVREAGTQNLLVKVAISVLTPKRNYTFVNRGSYKGTKAATLYATY